MVDAGICVIDLLSSVEVHEAWAWIKNHISIEQVLIEDHGYNFDHKHWHYPGHIICVDQCENADLLLARLYLVSQLAPVSDYLISLKNDTRDFILHLYSELLDEDVARVVNAIETRRNLNSFRNSLSEHLAYWAILASIIKSNEFNDFSVVKPNLQPEDKGPDGLAYIVCDDHAIIKIISVKNSINPPKDLISSAGFRTNDVIEPDCTKMLDEFYAFQYQNRGFQRLDEKLNSLSQELHQDTTSQIRHSLLLQQSHFNGAVVANEEHVNTDLFTGYSKISDKPIRCIGIYIGSANWRDFAYKVQKNVKEILSDKGINF